MASMILLAGSCAKKAEKRENLHPKIGKLKLPEDFVAEHLYSPSEHEQGSWVSMTFDDKGRMIVSDQFGSLYRLTIPPIGGDSSEFSIEKLKLPPLSADTTSTGEEKVQIGYAHGLLYAFNSLYVMVNHREDERFEMGSGLYRMQDTDGDDQYDKVTLIKALNGEGEHGPHSIIMSPDSTSLYVVAGNHTDVPEMNSYRLPKVWDEDSLFPLIKDPRGHAVDRMAPGGWIAHIDSLGENWELISAGYRNPFDIAFNDAGDLFTYDSDMEWDFGLPWYRPTRICHVTSGSEFGWRTGSGKWRPSFPDNLPPVMNIGPGSPTNFIYGRPARFPAGYRQSFFAFDWSFGIIYQIKMKPNGASYTAEGEEFLSGIPLPLTDGVFGPDGALYFLTGGRRLESDLYRVYYNDYENEPLVAETASPEITREHRIRTELEAYHREAGKEAVEFAWPYLDHTDRFVRYAARIAVEHQPLNEWQEKALNETDPERLIQAMIALARHGEGKDLGSQMLSALLKIDFDGLGKKSLLDRLKAFLRMDSDDRSEERQLDLIRAFELVLYRTGMPDDNLRKEIAAYLNPHFPAGSVALDRELGKLLVFLQAPEATEKTLALLNQEESGQSENQGAKDISDLIMRNPQYGMDIAGMLEKMPPANQTYYATVLSRQQAGWTPELRDRYFKWFAKAFGYQGGRSYIGFIDKARKRALDLVPEDQYAHFNTLSGDSLLTKSGNDLVQIYQPKGPGRHWTMEEGGPLVENGLTKRDFEQGRKMYLATNCSRCHTMQGEGGTIGPDLTQLGTRFSPKDMLEAIVDPNKAISDQYAALVFELKNGSSLTGRLVNEDRENYYISQNPFAPDVLKEIPKNDVASHRSSSVSVMLPGLVNGLNEEELKDLIAYLVAGGDKNHQVFKK